LEKAKELCRSGFKGEDENLKTLAKQPPLKTRSPPHPQAGSPKFEPSCHKQKKEKEKNTKYKPL
jgi:hypothetical protein